VAQIGLVGEGDLQDTNIMDDRGRDGGDEEEDRGGEEEEGTNVVNDTSFVARHFCGIGGGCYYVLL